ncbi:Methyltransferase domain-containing protein [Algoriphagus ornithinivorans]|uniref:Methyltransferase domain-containing protein n=2 Tax=Algoriphagus ornithinivorans TaxID=226506 RepID=A0A1I5HL68_9BACT|nr:Methyltransferase domain-containing protein [Algoriphagus ornithinivorans]
MSLNNISFTVKSHMLANSLKKSLYGLYRSFYRKTNSYKKSQELSQALKKEEENLQHQILNKLGFNDQMVVLQGPFKGMKYGGMASGSMLLPKIIGAYEEPIHDWVSQILASNKYKRIIDVGCAEGFYAIGFARSIPTAQIIACDINENALALAKELSVRNGLKNIDFIKEVDHKFLDQHCDESTLLFCDIEGHELTLLDPLKSKNLLKCEILVEVHDCFFPGIQKALVERFQASHAIQIALDYSGRVLSYPLHMLSEKEKRYALDERRPKGMSWLYMKPFSNS